MNRNIAGLFLLLALSACAFCEDISVVPGAKSVPYGYSPANYFTSGLTVFPLQGKVIGSGLSFGPGARVAFGPEGKSIYATAGPRGLERFDLSSHHSKDLIGSNEFVIFDFAVTAREERIMISGVRSGTGVQTCGVFELDAKSGNGRQVLANSDCDYLSAWTDLSLSPSGLQAVALHNKRLELLDFANKTSKPFGSSEYWTAAWAPDGRWIAALDRSGQSRLFLIDPSDLSHGRRLGATGGGLHWSPDSRYLLLFKEQFRCGLFSYFYSMETLEISTGKRSVVSSSQCRIEGGPSGWVDANAFK